MAHEQHTYICIDLKTFYASVECVDRGLDPLTTNLSLPTNRADARPSASLSRRP